jgi:serine/threonine-protein kinase
MTGPETKPTVDIRRDIKRCPACAQRFTGEAGFCPFDGIKLETAPYEPLGDPLLGTTIDGRYEVQALLGEGGMGQVYRVRHTTLDRLFALKVLRRELARDEELGARFIEEARSTASVRHPNVVQITDFGKLPSGVPFFVMELLVGQSLADVVKTGGPLPVAAAVRVAGGIAAALGAAHAAGIVHRDLKPDNVFLVGGVAGGVVSGDVRVVDFGAAKVIGSSRVTRQGVVWGTPAYMSPEQASGQPVDHRTDVYALGIILYEMLCGRVPFEADTYMGVLTQHMFVQPVPPSRVAPSGREMGAIEDITLVCLSKKPEDRFASMQDMVSALDAVVRRRPDGTTEIAPRLREIAAGQDTVPPARAPAMRYRMADELEPPTLEEIRAGTERPRLPMRRVPWPWLVGAVGVGVAALVWAIVARTGRSTPSTAASAEAVSVAPRPLPPPPLPVTMPSSTAAAGSAPRSVETGPSTQAPSPVTHAPPVSPGPIPPGRHPPVPKGKTPSGLDDIGDPFAAKH